MARLPHITPNEYSQRWHHSDPIWNVHCMKTSIVLSTYSFLVFPPSFIAPSLPTSSLRPRTSNTVGESIPLPALQKQNNSNVSMDPLYHSNLSFFHSVHHWPGFYLFPALYRQTPLMDTSTFLNRPAWNLKNMVACRLGLVSVTHSSMGSPVVSIPTVIWDWIVTLT